MSRLTEFLRTVTGGLWPASGSAVTRPLLAKWNREAARPPACETFRTASAAELTIEHFRRAPVYADRIEQLYQAYQRAPAKGHVMELGVYRGATLNRLAEWALARGDARVFGFDSFEGLPHEWIRKKDGYRYDARHFALQGLPCVVDNVELVPGFFEDSLGPWLAENAGPIAFLHNDSDLYSSTLTTLRMLNERIEAGTVIVFDELCDWRESGEYDNWEAGEWKALREWMAECQRRIAIVSRDEGFAAAIQVVE